MGASIDRLKGVPKVREVLEVPEVLGSLVLSEPWNLANLEP
jgi:hypothetical protein